MPNDPDALAEADEIAKGLLVLYARLGVQAVFLTRRESKLHVRCQRSADVEPMCRRVVKEHEAPEGRVLN